MSSMTTPHQESGPRLKFADLGDVKLHGSFATKDVDKNLDFHSIFVDLGNRGRQVGKWTFLDPDTLAHLELELRLGSGRLRLSGALFAFHLDLQNVLDFLASQ